MVGAVGPHTAQPLNTLLGKSLLCSSLLYSFLNSFDSATTVLKISVGATTGGNMTLTVSDFNCVFSIDM